VQLGVEGLSSAGVGVRGTGSGVGNAGVVGWYGTDVGFSPEAAGVQGYGDTQWGGFFKGTLGGIKAVATTGTGGKFSSTSGLGLEITPNATRGPINFGILSTPPTTPVVGDQYIWLDSGRYYHGLCVAASPAVWKHAEFV